MTTKLQTHLKYKPSGVDWLGNIPVGWDIVPTRSVFKTKKQVVGSNAEKHLLLGLTLGGVKPRDLSLGGKNPADYENYQIFEPGELVMCLFDYDVTPRTVGYVKQKGMMTGAYTRLIPRAKLEPRYYYYLFLYFDEKKELLHLCTGLRNSIAKHVFWSLQNPLPPFETQKRIADFLDERAKVIDELVAKKEKLIELLREKRVALITRAVTKGIDPNAKLKSSGTDWLGDIPERWEVKRLKFCLRLINERGSSDSENKIALENIEGGTGRYIETDSNYEGGTRFYKNDVLFGKLRPYLAKVFLTRNDGEAVGDILVYRANKNILPKFAFYFFLSDGFIDIVNSSTFGAKMPRAESFFIGNLVFIYPDIKKQERIADFLDTETGRIDKAVKFIESQIEKLKEYRSSLIYSAVIGKIKNLI